MECQTSKIIGQTSFTNFANNVRISVLFVYDLSSQQQNQKSGAELKLPKARGSCDINRYQTLLNISESCLLCPGSFSNQFSIE